MWDDWAKPRRRPKRKWRRWFISWRRNQSNMLMSWLLRVLKVFLSSWCFDYLVEIEETEDITHNTPIEAWKGPKTSPPAPEPINKYQHRHENQVGIITEQKRRLAQQERQIRELLTAKDVTVDAVASPKNVPKPSKPQNKCIAAIIKLGFHMNFRTKVIKHNFDSN